MTDWHLLIVGFVCSNFHSKYKLYNLINVQQFKTRTSIISVKAKYAGSVLNLADYICYCNVSDTYVINI